MARPKITAMPAKQCKLVTDTADFQFKGSEAYRPIPVGPENKWKIQHTRSFDHRRSHCYRYVPFLKKAAGYMISKRALRSSYFDTLCQKCNHSWLPKILLEMSDADMFPNAIVKLWHRTVDLYQYVVRCSKHVTCGDRFHQVSS